MASCNGNGECLTQCECECYNEETDEYNEICCCGHREHNGNCPSNCCVPFECRNYKYCNVKQPKWVSFCHNGMCMNCAVQMGKHKYTNEVEDAYSSAFFDLYLFFDSSFTTFSFFISLTSIMHDNT